MKTRDVILGLFLGAASSLISGAAGRSGDNGSKRDSVVSIRQKAEQYRIDEPVSVVRSTDKARGYEIGDSLSVTQSIVATTQKMQEYQINGDDAKDLALSIVVTAQKSKEYGIN